MIPIYQGAEQDPFYATEQFKGWFTELDDPRWQPTSMPTYLEEFGYFADVLSIQGGQEALLGQRTAEDVATEWADYLTEAQQKWLASRGSSDASAPGAAPPRAAPPRVVLEPWLYLGPALILIALVMLVPLIVGISYAFRDVRSSTRSTAAASASTTSETLLRDQTFCRALGNTLWWTCLVVIQFVLGLGWRCCSTSPSAAAGWSRPWSSCPGRCRASSPASTGPGCSTR